MSYNSYSNNYNYSPYAYQQPTNQDGRTSYENQTTNSNTYQPYQPLSAYQSAYRAQSSASQSSTLNAHSSQSYTNPSTTATDRTQEVDTRYSDSRNSVDTTALGNLAYASSLGRDSPNSGTTGYTRPQSTAGYSSPSTYDTIPAAASYNTGHERSSSAGYTVQPRVGSTGAQPAAASSSYGYSTNTEGNSYQTQTPSMGFTQPSYSGPQSKPNYNYGHQMARPSNSQASSRGGLPSTTVAGTTAVAGQYRRDSTGGQPSRLQNQTPTQPAARAPNAGVSTNPPSGSYNPSASSKSIPCMKSASTKQKPASGQASSPKGHYSPAVSKATLSQQVNTPAQSGNQSSTPTSATSNTVDPSQVFNQVEYQRRQAEAEAAKKKAEEERVAASTPQAAKPSGSTENPDSARKNQMELEMRQIIEKMRDYKSMDPALFAEVWEGVKKGTPPARAPSQQPAVAMQSPPVASPALANGQSQGSPVTTGQLPPASELPDPDSSFPPGFDRGRYPAQRRRRGNAHFTLDRNAKPSHKKKSTPESATPDPTNQPNSTTPPGHISIPITVHVSGKGPELIQSHVPPPERSQSGPQQLTTATSSTNVNASSLNQSKGGTYWPEDKKQALSEAARRTLSSHKANAGKNITSAEILVILNQNPSYQQMCERIEQMGFTIDRSQFARDLLHAVPDLGRPHTNTAPPPPPKSQPPPPGPLKWAPPNSVASKGPFTIPYGNPPGLSAPVAPMGQYPGVPPGQAYNYARSQMTPEQRQHYDHGAGRGGPPAPPMNGTSRPTVRWADYGVPQQVLQPVTKQDLARKRSFGDIVDLTQAMSDDEDEEPSLQRPRLVNGKNNASTQPDKSSGPIDGANGPAVDKRDVEAPRVASTQTPLANGQSLENFRFKPSDKMHLLYSRDIVKPMDPRQDALRRSSYNPKTVSRDFLLATGKHPTMAPLNAHLDILRERFRTVDYDSDLGTFRWDLVDPGGPELEPTPEPEPEVKIPNSNEDIDEEAGLTHHRPQVAVVIGTNNGTSDQIMLSSVTNMRLIRHLDSKDIHHKRTHHNIRQFRGGFSKFSTRPLPTVPADPIDFSKFVHKDLPSKLRSITDPTTSTTPDQSFDSSTPPSSGQRERVPGRRGRPPGAKNKSTRPDKGISKGAWNSLKSRRGSHVIGSSPLQDENSSSPEPTPSRTIPNRPRIDTTPAQPSGLRNAITPTTADGIAVMLHTRSPSVSNSQPPSARSSKTSKFDRSKATDPSPTKPSSTPTYQIYKCHWDTCPAELHNLETLKKHVRKHRHGKNFAEGVPCLWKNCYTGDVTVPHLPDVFEGGGGERYVFEDEGEWDRHLVEEHLLTEGGREKDEG